MNGRIVRFGGSPHAQVDRLLPWWVNGTLGEEERLQVERHLAECAPCRREAAWLHALQQGYAAEEETAADLAPSMRRLRRRLEAERGSGARPFLAAPRWLGGGTRWLAWLAAAQAVAILALGAVLYRQDRPPSPTYHTLAAPHGSHALLVVVFDPRLDEAQMRRLLRTCDARIVDGPTETGAYLLSVPDGEAESARRMLHEAAGVVMVERLDADGRR
ncbi:zf-HC2 domain-containing protein [Frateuria defendens]|uniref:zf-HC2 domain-containing protein n=1 Tax=Frateuria defendens TaxID=2219559 RepID=UPI00066FCA42|nr:zf-HC2 domain-containing protein [Frateuria defendens]